MNKQEREAAALTRLAELKRYEQELHKQGITLIAGVDEVGRGPLAGPVVAAAVILPLEFYVLGVDDSKKLSEKKREALYDEIMKHCICSAIGIVDHREIDRINILQATRIAMQLALEGLTVRPEHVLIDALELPAVTVPQTGIIKGDSASVSIAAASILAKVTRDRMMQEFHLQYPGYCFDRNKGYGTREHYEGIQRQGLCTIHRRTFLQNL